MNLIQLIRRNLIVSMLVIILIGSVSHFFIFRFFIHYSTDEILYEYKNRITNYITVNDTLALATELVLQPARIEANPIVDAAEYPSEIFKDTLLYSEMTGSFTPYRQLYFPVTYKNKSFLVNINQPTMESDDLLYAVISSLLLLFILFILFTYAISYSLRRSIWRPLSKNLKRLKAYDLRANTKLDLENHKIQEFDELNNVIMRMVHKINEDYENSRIFAEDASHEMQTPLSIIKSKIDLLLQENIPQNEQISGLIAMSRAVTRLSRLSRSLLLLTKINNNQFQNKEYIDISLHIQNYMSDLSELIDAKNIRLNCKMEPCVCHINPILSEVLISNILSNAIKHNIENGKINIYLHEGILTVENNCIEPEFNENLFNRLSHRKKTEESSTGLGLNIVKSICDKNGFDIEYEFIEKTTFRLKIHLKA